MEPCISITILDLPKVIFAHAPAGGIVSGLGNFVPGLGIIGGALSMGSKGCPSLPILILQFIVRVGLASKPRFLSKGRASQFR